MVSNRRDIPAQHAQRQRSTEGKDRKKVDVREKRGYARDVVGKHESEGARKEGQQ